MERLATNQTIGDYRITGFLGAGGMGEVYQGIHTKLSRLAAIKILNDAVIGSSLSARFMNEARVQSSLHHPNIVTLYDFQEIGGRLFIFMEFLDGENLENLIERKALTVDDALRMFAEIAEAVAYIHSRGIVHRDIKSQNIRVTSGGVIKLLDFGIAKDSQSQNLTRTGGVIGTPRYLSPEQLNGRPASPQTDIWALGVLFYEMLTGVEPFASESLGTLYLQVNEARYEKPERLNPQVTGQISRIVARCLKSSAMERYQSVAELAHDVRRVIEERERKSRSLPGRADEQNPETDQSFSTSLRKSPLLAIALGSAAAVVVLFCLIAVAVMAMQSGDAPPANKNNQTGNQRVNSRLSNQKTAIVTTTDASPSSAPATNQNQIRIDTFGGAAAVFRNGRQIGVTPLDLPAENGERIDVTLKRSGYEDKTISFDVAAGQKLYTFMLKPSY